MKHPELVTLYRKLVPGKWFAINQLLVEIGSREHAFFIGRGWGVESNGLYY